MTRSPTTSPTRASGAPSDAKAQSAGDPELCYRAVQARDRRFDGVFYTGVHTTGIYCRPSCPATTPRRRNVSFYRTAAAAQAAGFRACRRCRPDLTPGSPEWDVKADVAGRVMRMIADGVVERDGVEGLASRAGYTSRHLNRVLTEQLGAGPLALARAHRAHTARVLIETTDLGFADVAFAAGFASVRQFNATVAEVYAATPTQLRAAAGVRRVGDHSAAGSGRVRLSLPVRAPFDGGELVRFLASRAIPGVESADLSLAGPTYTRTLRLPHATGVVSLTTSPESVACDLSLDDWRDLTTAVERCHRLLDLDADPTPIAEHLSADDVLRPLVAKHPGLRVPGHVDGFEAAVRAIVGQQISVSGARTLLQRIVERHGDDRSSGSTDGQPIRLFPTAESLAHVDPSTLPMPRSRAQALVGLARSVADGDLVLDRSADRSDVRAALLRIPGIGPWTADYIALRALGDPDVFLSTDLGVRQALQHLRIPSDEAAARVAGWRPWRSYALMYVWRSLPQFDRVDPPNRNEGNLT